MAEIICVGEALIDFVCTDRTKQLESGVNFMKKAGGAPANVCAAITKLGSTAAFVGKVGKDSFGRFLKNTLEEVGIDATYCLVDENKGTTLALVALDEEGERDFEFIRGADENLQVADITFEDFSSCKLIHLGSATALLGGPLYETYKAFIQYGLENKKLISFDPNYRTDLFKHDIPLFQARCKEVLQYTDIVKVSIEEGQMITDKEEMDEVIDTLHEFGAKVVVITLGKDGSKLSVQKEKVQVPSIPVKMVDATGAGDAYIGALLALLCKEEKLQEVLLDVKKMEQIVAVANKVGAKTTEKYGAIAAIPTLKEVL